jgi:ABC-type glycerol-3-phosphate transport system permease component
VQSSRPFKIMTYTVLTVLVVLQLIPLCIMIVMSFKSQSQVAMNPLVPTFPLHLENYVRAWLVGIKRYILNSVFLTVTILVGNLSLSCITAYVFARYDFPGKGFLFTLILALMVIPGITTLIPRYVLIRDLKLLNTYWGVILPGVFGANAFNIFVLRTFFASLPEELFEAARLDGAGHLAIFGKLVVPLSWAIISSLAILQVLGTWNSYIWPLLVLGRDKLRTVAIGLVYFADNRNPQIGVQMAASMIASIPLFVLFFAAMRTFIQGLSEGALKL